ncbi:MAG: Hsp20/alpha crystallin family protein [Akkermansiaceae bacterium]|nr:Hsp20/alpha crystallin family protein [Akkermansiaceae bacterium]
MKLTEKNNKAADKENHISDKPKNQVTRMNNEMDHQQNRSSEQVWLRPYYETESLESGDYTLRVWMPGVPKEDVAVALDDDVLTISGHRRERHPDDWKPVFTELPFGDYRLRLNLNIKVDEDRIKARVENGILTLDLPISEAAKPRKITIK